jgi:hypothetical protein
MFKYSRRSLLKLLFIILNCIPSRPTSLTLRRRTRTMASPENDLTTLVPISVVSKTRKNSRHGAPEERIARGPTFVGSSSPEAVRRIPQTMEGPVEEEKPQRSNGKGKQPMVDSDVEFVAEVKVENRSEGVRRTSVVSVTMHDDTSDDEGQDLCVICLQAVRDPTIVGECGHQIFCVRSPAFPRLRLKKLMNPRHLSLNA